MTRCDNWPRALSDAREKMADEPFVWGTHDCATAACTVVEAFTGVDLADGLRGTYSTRSGALRRLGELHGGGLESACEALATKHGISEEPVTFAQRGDLVLADQEDGPMLGVVGTNGRHAIFAGETGAVWIPVRQCRRAWRV